MIHVAACPVCSGTKLDPYLSTIDYAVTQEPFSLVVCNTCQQLITSPRPPDETLAKYYASAHYIPHHSKGNSILSIVYNGIRNYMTGYKIRRIAKFIGDGTLLDYGAGNGFFLKSLHRKGYPCRGYEPSLTAIANAHPTIKPLLYNQIADIDQKYQMITLWHVLEHISTVNETINWIYHRLHTKGYTIVAVPNINAYERNIYRDKWAAFDVPRHLWHFHQKSIIQLYKKHGFEYINQFPLLFDAYFVALLSEQYKGTKMPWIKALYNGFKSNQKAKKSTEYTSIAYIFRKPSPPAQTHHSDTATSGTVKTG